jgi:hypothetical protein
MPAGHDLDAAIAAGFEALRVDESAHEPQVVLALWDRDHIRVGRRPLAALVTLVVGVTCPSTPGRLNFSG